MGKEHIALHKCKQKVGTQTNNSKESKIIQRWLLINAFIPFEPIYFGINHMGSNLFPLFSPGINGINYSTNGIHALIKSLLCT